MRMTDPNESLYEECEKLLQYKEYHEFAESQIREVIGEFQTLGELAEEFKKLKKERDTLKQALHSISIGSQNSMTSKEDLGREARAVFDAMRKGSISYSHPAVEAKFKGI